MPLTSIDFGKLQKVLLVLLLYLIELYRLVLVQVQAAKQLHYIWLHIQTGSSHIWLTFVNVSHKQM